MSTLIKNIGILDARHATPEQIQGIGKLVNIGCLAISPQNKADFLKVSLLNVGKMLELDEEYKLHTGPLEITAQMLEDAPRGLKLCVVGPLTLEAEISPELLRERLIGLCLIGPASVPAPLYGAFMSSAREIVGPVASVPVSGVRTSGRVEISNEYLNTLKDGTELSVQGSLKFADTVDEELFLRKIKSLRVVGAIKCGEPHEAMLRKVLLEPEKARIRIVRLDFHYVPGNTMLDTFTMMTVNKQTISCYGILILLEEISEELIRKKDLRFEAGTLYFPKNVMHEMAQRLAPGTRGIPYEPNTLEVIGCEQTITPVRLEAMPDKATLVVTGELNFAEDVAVSAIAGKIGVLDNYGQITASRDAASILQGKLRHSEGVIRVQGADDDDEPECGQFDNVIENVATYVM